MNVKAASATAVTGNMRDQRRKIDPVPVRKVCAFHDYVPAILLGVAAYPGCCDA
jgi:hypothetical protein